jgi:hypothetical protein
VTDRAVERSAWRAVAFMAALALALVPGCERRLPAPPARTEPGVDSPADRAALRKLFDDAAACGDR